MSSEISALVDRLVGPIEDRGEARLREAHLRQSVVDAIVKRISMLHAVSADALTGRHKAKSLHHVVMARAHAAHALRAAGYSFPQIGRALGSDHSQAQRWNDLWSDHAAGNLKPVDEATGRRALAIMRRYDLSTRQAAERLGVSHLKLKGRISTIRSKDKAGARNV